MNSSLARLAFYVWCYNATSLRVIGAYLRELLVLQSSCVCSGNSDVFVPVAHVVLCARNP